MHICARLNCKLTVDKSLYAQLAFGIITFLIALCNNASQRSRDYRIALCNNGAVVQNHNVPGLHKAMVSFTVHICTIIRCMYNLSLWKVEKQKHQFVRKVNE